MWKPEHRRAADRHGLRYPSDLSDREWALIEPAIPPAKRGGRRREVNVREVLNAIFYVLSTGCQCQALPKDLPPKSTAHSYFMLRDWDGTPERIHQALYIETRGRGCRAARAAASTGRWVFEIVKRNELNKFVVLPKRWIVERTLAWISRNRRLARDFERYARTVAAFVRLAMIRIMLRRLTRATHST